MSDIITFSLYESSSLHEQHKESQLTSMQHPIEMVVIKLMDKKSQRINILLLAGNEVTVDLFNIKVVFIAMVYASAHISAPAVHFCIQFGEEVAHALVKCLC